MSTPRINNLDNVAVVLSRVAAPNTTVVDRALMVDLDNDLAAHGQTTRFPVHGIYPIIEEQGPAGEVIFGAINDKFGQIRLAGNWIEGVNSLGPNVNLPNDEEGFVEFTFKGTDAYMLYNEFSSGVVEWQVSVDGGVETDLFPTNVDETIRNRNTSANQRLLVASGLAFGVHTVRIRAAGTTPTLILSGFEVVNGSGQVRINPGVLANGKSLAAHVSDFDGGFDVEEGTDVGAGGAVLYYEEGGQTKKAIRWAEDNQQNLGSADFTEHEFIARHHFREYGNGFSQDLTLLGASTADSVGTLSSGESILYARQALVDNPGIIQGLRIAGASNGYLAITFVGTGLAIRRQDNGPPGNNPHDVFVDGGTSVGQINLSSEGDQIQSIVSGLPFGKHTVRINEVSASGANIHFKDLLVYGPKRPALPAGAVPLHYYGLLADYDGTTATGVLEADNEEHPQGVYGKVSTREWSYRGTNWVIGFIGSAGLIFQFAETTTNSESIELDFVGTGVNLHMLQSNAGTSDFELRIDGVLNASAVVRTPANGSNLGGGSYRVLDPGGNIRPARFEVTGLTEGRHKVSITRTAGSGATRVMSADIIGSMYAHKLDGPDLFQNELRVGSSSTLDLRRFDKDEPFNHARTLTARDIQNNGTASTSKVPMTDMHGAIRSDGREYLFNFEGVFFNSSAGAVNRLHLVINGSEDIRRHSFQIVNGVPSESNSFTRRVYLPPGEHFVAIFFEAAAGTLNILDNSPTLTVTPLAKD